MRPTRSITGKLVTWFISEEAFGVPEALPAGPLAGGSPIEPDEGTTEPLGFVVGMPPGSDGDGAGEKYESGSAVGGAMSVGNCCCPASSSSKQSMNNYCIKL